MCDERRSGARVRIGSRPEITIWFIGWLFTLGYLKLTFWKAVFALVIWPYYLGVAVR